MAFPVGPGAACARHAELPLSPLAVGSGPLHVRGRPGVPDGHRAATTQERRGRVAGGHGRAVRPRRGPGVAALFRHTDLFPRRTTLPEAMLFLGASMCITAFPMLARIIHFKKLAGTTMGTVALGAGDHRRRDGVVPAGRGARVVRPGLEPRAGQRRRRRGLRGGDAARRAPGPGPGEGVARAGRRAHRGGAGDGAGADPARGMDHGRDRPARGFRGVRHGGGDAARRRGARPRRAGPAADRGAAAAALFHLLRPEHADRPARHRVSCG